MTPKDKAILIFYLLFLGLAAFVMSKTAEENMANAMRFQIILCVPYFMGYYEGARKISVSVVEMQILEAFGWMLYHTVSNLMIPLMSLSLAIGNVLASFNAINAWQGLALALASSIVVLMGCLVGTAIGYLKCRFIH
jgi:hypothetical protein